VMFSFLHALFSTASPEKIYLITAIAAPLIPLVMVDVARRIMEMVDKADTNSINPDYDTAENELNPEFEPQRRTRKSLNHFWENPLDNSIANFRELVNFDSEESISKELK
jgi:hypothetical protein